MPSSRASTQKDNAFDLIDLLILLRNDHASRLYPFHKNFHQNGIEHANKVIDGSQVFTPDQNVSVPFLHFIHHKSALNLSLRVTIPGTVELPYGAYTLGFHAKHQAHIFCTYPFIVNAKPTITYLPVTLSREIYFLLRHKGIIRNHHVFVPTNVIALHLTRMPLCNKQRISTANDWHQMARLAIESLKLENILKVLYAKRDELCQERINEQLIAFTEPQREFLAACGVCHDGSFNTPVEKIETTNVLDMRTLEIKIDKNIPVTMKDFSLMCARKKKWNYVGDLMLQGHSLMRNCMPTHHIDDAITWLDTTIDYNETKKHAIDIDLFGRRLAVVLACAWSFDTEETTVNVDGHAVTLRYGTIEKKISA